MHARVHVCARVHLCTDERVRVCAQMSVYVCVHARVHGCVCVRACAKDPVVGTCARRAKPKPGAVPTPQLTVFISVLGNYG